MCVCMYIRVVVCVHVWVCVCLRVLCVCVCVCGGGGGGNKGVGAEKVRGLIHTLLNLAQQFTRFQHFADGQNELVLPDLQYCIVL